uniref:LEC14B n=1 Tax=Arundo donax TaxID=35708 RepID=A0A0A9E4Q9_ARUDO
MSHNLIAWSFPLDMKLRPSPRLSICVTPCKCPVKTPAASPVDKQRLSQTSRLQRSHTIALLI